MRHSGPRPAHHRDRRRSDASPATRPLLRQAAHGPQAKIPGHDNSVAMQWGGLALPARPAKRELPGASTAPCLSDTVTPVGSKSPSRESAVWVDGFKSAEPPISVGNRGATAFMTFRPATRVAMPFSSRRRPEYPLSHPSGNSPCMAWTNAFARSGNARPYAEILSFHSVSADFPRSIALRKCSPAFAGM